MSSDMWRIILLSYLLVCLLACQAEKKYVDDEIDRQLEYQVTIHSPSGDFDHFILPSSSDYSSIPQETANPLTEAKVELGRMLFYETGIGLEPVKSFGKETYSCASCHLPTAGFRPGAAQGIADGGVGYGSNGELRTKFISYEPTDIDAQGIRALSVLNVGFVSNTFWNGQFGSNDINVGTEDRWDEVEGAHVNYTGFKGLEAQNIEGVKAHRMSTNREVMERLGYLEMYNAAFPDFPEESRFTDTTASFALSAYLRTLLADEAPFQKWLKGKKSAMTDQQKRGAVVFFDKANCVSCHSGKAFSAVNFYALGVNDLYQRGGTFGTSAEDIRNLGRGGFTGLSEDMHKFKVPQLYNLGDAPFFFHGSSKFSLEEVVEYFDRGVPENPRVPEEQISSLLRPLYLTPQEKEDLVEFLTNGLRDPNLARYVPDAVLSGNCFPNNDPFSQIDLGCN
ncbi:MAG: hypothetical protein KJP00_05645 [Bacteroidia bacterium]|nr:hypothetical protein [Bacteroidia bacterium]